MGEMCLYIDRSDEIFDVELVANKHVVGAPQDDVVEQDRGDGVDAVED